MSNNKKYFWLKLKDDFFTSREIKKLRKIAGGDTYTIIYLKMQLLSIKKEGLLVYEGTEEDIVEQLSLELDEETDNISVTLSFLQANNLIEQLSENEFLLNKVPECIGNETDAAERMRKMRAKRNNVTHALQPVTKSYTEKELEKELELELEKDIESELEEDILSEESDHASEIIDYLNLKAGTAYRTTTKKTKTLIKARLDEGFSLDDFRTVIDKKTREWKGTDMEKYLRPETLFGTKFEGYLNQPVKREQVESTGNPFFDMLIEEEGYSEPTRNN